MRHFKFAPLFFLLACTERQAPTKITVDVGQFAQMQVPVSSLGLLVLTAPLADAAAQEDRAASDAGETISTSAPPPPGAGSVTIGDPKPPMNTGARGADAPSGPQTGAVAVPETEPNAAGQPPPPPVFYTEVALDDGTSTFSVDVPSGPHQSLFLYGFGAPAAADKAPIPNYVAAAVNVALQAGAEQTVRFKMYPAGVVVPQILKPSLVGLVDANNQPIAKVPDDLSCLAVAHAQAPRDGFPVDMVAKIRVGSITQASQLGPASVLVLPVGDYQLSCFAQFAGKLFAVNPPVAVHVDKGKVSVATGTLVKVRDLVVAGGGTGGTAGGTGPGGTTVPGDNTTAPPGSDGTQVTPPGSAQPPRFSVYISPPSASPARQNMTGDLGALSEEPNFDNTTDMNVTIVARHADGSVDFDYNNEVVLRVTPAIDRTLKGTEKASGGIWQPFATQTGTLRMPVLSGAGVSPMPLRLGQLAVPTGAIAADRATMQFILTVHPINGAGVPTRAFGARMFTVRGDLGCRVQSFQQFDAWFATTLTENQNELTIFRDLAANTFTGLKEHVIIAALTPATGTPAPSRCVFTAAPLGALATIFLVPLNQQSVDKLAPGPMFTPHTFPAGTFPAQGMPVSGFKLSFFGNPAGQGVAFDAIAPVPPAAGSNPPAGTTLTNLGYNAYDSLRTNTTSPPQFKMSAVVK